MAHKPVGISTTLSISTSSAKTGALEKQSDTIRVVVAAATSAHVAIGTEPTATANDYFIPAGGTATISIGSPKSQRVVGIITGTTTTLDFPEGTGSPFEVGDFVSLTVSGQSDWNFAHKRVKSVDTSASFDGYFSTRIVVENDTSTGAPATFNGYADLRESFKVALLATSATGTAYIQQVQVSGVA